MQKPAQFDDRIRNLIALAQDGSTHSRTLLFSHICDLFLQRRPMASDTQVRMLTEILKELLSQVEIETRQGIVTALCALTAPPTELTDIMSEDVVEVSGPLLEKAILPDEKLIHLIRYGTEAHRIHISRRFGLSPLVRHELERAQKAAQSSKLKYSLSELERLAGDENPDLDEETTINILELLRAQNIHKTYTEDDKKATASGTAPEAETPRLSIFSNVRPEKTSSPDAKPTAPTAAPQKSEPKTTEHVYKDRAPSGDTPLSFPSDKVANDASFPEKPRIPEPMIHMEEAVDDLTTDLREQVQHARDESQRQRELVRSVADWFWEVDRTGSLSFLSEEAFTVFGRPVQSLIGEDMISLCTPPPPEDDTKDVPESFEALFERRTSFRDVPFYIDSQHGDKTLWYVSAIAIFDINTGRFTGFRGSARAEDAPEQTPYAAEHEEHKTATPEKHVASFPAETDITPQNIPHEEVAAELLHNLSHEFRTPLNAIIGFSEMIDMEAWGPVNEKYHQNTKSILAAAVQLKEAVNDVLDSAKIEAGLMQIDPESFSLKAVLKACQENVATMAHDMQVELIDNSNNIDVILYNDKQSVELCLTKILASTLKRAQAGETLSPSVLINSNAQVRIEIPLLGPRIDEKDAPELFEKLQTTPVETQNNQPYPQKNTLNYTPKVSTGFGLSIAQNLAHLIGGNISTHISQGKVSHLVLTLTNHDLPG
ncbi:histidine kinase dimerization/phospho-acceptor domain-containing protein [Paremcibacter congregatus]|uniref:histidine kinase dimerization/phospho-acceptor domain-containing protein n=1 Tax=Paremcibacter congregatus TaxID=2043170 RepID=UPI003A8D329D